MGCSLGCLMNVGQLLQSPLISGLLSGLFVAVTNHLFTKRKTAAEIEKLQAEAELTRAQAKQLTDNVNNLSDKVGYKLPEIAQASEAILYTSETSDTFDFRLVKVGGGDGEVEVKEGILYIRRTNTEGGLQIWLESYKYPGKPPQRVLEKSEDISGDRKLRISCEVKAVAGEHTIVFTLKGEGDPDGVHMADKRQRVTSNEWMPLEAYFRVSPAKTCRFRIDDRSVSMAGSSVQIRKLVLAERMAVTPELVTRG
jgi:cell division protein FtsB